MADFGTARVSTAPISLTSVVAVDVAGDGVWLTPATRVRGRLRWEPTQHVSAVPGEGLRERLQEIIGSRPCVAAMPVHESIIRWIRPPLDSLRKARKVFASLLDLQLPFPVEDCVHFFPCVERGPKGIEALGVAARIQDVRLRLQKLAELGVDPIVLDHEGMALWDQALREHPAPEPQARIVVGCYPDRWVIVVGRCGAGAAPLLWGAHALRGGESQDPIFSSDPDRWLPRLRRILDAHAASLQGLPLEWLWVGPGAEDADLLEGWRRALGPLTAYKFGAANQPAGFQGRALATRALTETEWPINFRQGDLEHAGVAAGRRRRERASTAAIWVVGLGLCALGIGWSRFVDRHKDRMQEELLRNARELAPGITLPYGQELRVAERTWRAQRESWAPFAAPFERGLNELLTEVLKQSRAGGLTLHYLELQRNSVAIHGTSPDWDRCGSLLGLLAQYGYDAVVERSEPGLDERVPFRIKGGRSP